MRAEPLAVLLSFILAFGPAAPAFAEDAPSLAVRIAEAQKQLAGHLSGATLARADYEPLETAYKAAAPTPAPEAKAAWDAFEPLAHRYNALRGGLLSLDNDGLNREVRELSRALSLEAKDEDALVERWGQLKATLIENGVTARGDKYYSHDGKPLSDAALNGLLAKALPARPTDEQRAAHIRDLQDLGEVRQALSKKDYQSAVDGLNKVLENMASRPDLAQSGFGSLPMQTALAMVQKTRDALPAQYRKQVKTDTLDRQLLEVAHKKIDVPAVTAQEAPREKHEQSPFRTGMELSFYASLTGFPLISRWAEKKLYATQGTDLLTKDKSVASFRYSEKAPDGAAKPGFYVTYKDGSRLYEARDGSSVRVSKDGKTTVEQNPAAGTYRQTVKGGADGQQTEVLAWERNKDGVTRGRFRGRAFEAARGQQVLLSEDQSKLFVIEGFGKDGTPNIKSWLGPDGERGKVLPGGLGTVVWHKENGRAVKDIFLEPEALKKAAAGGLDLSALGQDLDPARARKFQRLLQDLPQLGALFGAALGGETIKNKDGSSASHWVEAAQIRDGRLTLALGEKFDAPGKPGKAQTGFQLAADVENDGTLKLFLFKTHSTMMWKFDPAQNVCDQMVQDVEAQSEGKTAFKTTRRYERRGDKWEMTGNFPIELKEWSWTDGVKAVGAGALDGAGTVGEAVFSPFQTAHHYLHSGLVSGMSRAYGAATDDADLKRWADVDGKYTRAQATFNQYWSDTNVKDDKGRLGVYQDSLQTMGDAQRQKEFKSFLDMKVDEARRAQYGELYRFHRDDPIGEQDRANAAAATFGLSHLADNYSQMADEQFAKGNTWSGVGLKGVKYFVIGGEMYVQGAGFGAAANGLKTGLVAAKYGLTAEQVAGAAQRAALIEKGAAGVATLTKTEQAAVNSLKWIGRAETAVFLAPAGAQMGQSAAGGISALYHKDTKTALGHLDNFLSGAAGLVLPLGIGAGEKMANDAVVKVTQMRSTKTELVRSNQDKLLSQIRITDEKAADKAEQLFLTDSMTQMPNRSWMERSADVIKRGLKDPAVAVMDMNNFGAVNDGLISIYGPSAGRAKADGILSKAGFRLVELARVHDVAIARFGGEEIAVVGSRPQVLQFLEAAKLEFKDGQVLKDAGVADAEMKAINEAVIRKGRGGQSIGDFTTGVAAFDKPFNDAWHAADLALKAAKDAPGGRGNAFLEVVRNGKITYEPSPAALDADALARQNADKKIRDKDVASQKPGEIVDDITELKGRLGEEGYRKFSKVAYIDPLTQTREYDYVRAQVPELNKKYAKSGDASLISARGLKVINDALGHEAGDRYLAALGRELRSIIIDQRASGNWVEDGARIASKDFLIMGQHSGAVGRALEKAMRKVMAGTEVLSADQKAKVAELARTRGENPALTGTLRIVDTRFMHGGEGDADVYQTIDHLINLSEDAKKAENPVPPAPRPVNTK